MYVCVGGVGVQGRTSAANSEMPDKFIQVQMHICIIVIKGLTQLKHRVW